MTEVQEPAAGIEYQGDKVRINIWIKRALYQDAADIANSEDMSMTDVVRAALKDYVRRFKQGEI